MRERADAPAAGAGQLILLALHRPVRRRVAEYFQTNWLQTGVRCDRVLSEAIMTRASTQRTQAIRRLCWPRLQSSVVNHQSSIAKVISRRSSNRLTIVDCC